ncbi:MAG: ABC transporter permease [Candidatus Izemoplasmatales bacterium]|jgi:peptide/nickel transport system permease protein
MKTILKILNKIGTVLKNIFLSIWNFILKLWKHPKGKIGIIVISLLAICAIFAPLIAPYDPYDVTQRAAKGLAPSWEHLLGTTITTGQDIFSMLIYGTRVSLVIGLVTGISIAFVGAIMGILAGYIGGVVDNIIMRVVDILLVIPTLPLIIVLTNIFGKTYLMIIVIFVALGWTGLARVIRSLVLVLKNANYVKASELAGASRWHIMIKHILPGVSHLLIMSTALSCAGIMVAEAGLSFLGLGDPTAISWGKMLAEAQSGGALLFGHWWWIMAPGIGIFLAVFSFMRIGLALEEMFNPRMKQSNNMYKIFKHLNNTYLNEVFNSMNNEELLGIQVPLTEQTNLKGEN